MRQIVLDTETTGLEPSEGHRIIEIGGVELVERRPTGNNFHRYLQPDRDVEQGALNVHGITNAFLRDQPRFGDIAEEFLAYIRGAELIIHNAPFDVGFLNHELNRLTAGYKTIGDYCAILDTLLMARKKHPGQRNSLDALCKRYGIDNTHRNLHGALLDAEILAEVYLAMTGGQTTLLLEPEPLPQPGPGAAQPMDLAATRPRQRLPLKILRCTDAELAAHAARLEAIDKASGGHCLWKQAG